MTFDGFPTYLVAEAEPDGGLVLRICGELDSNCRDSIERAVLAAVASTESLIIDLAELTFCDSNGVAMFIAARAKARAEGTALAIRHVLRPVRRVFELAGLDALIVPAE